MSEKKMIKIFVRHIINFIICIFFGVCMIYSKENKKSFSFNEEHDFWKNYFILNPEKFAYLFPIDEEKDYFSFVTQQIETIEQLGDYYVILEFNNESGILNTYLLIKDIKEKYIIRCWDINKNEYKKRLSLKLKNSNSDYTYYYAEEEKILDGTSFFIFSNINNQKQRFCLYTKFWINKDFKKIQKLFDCME